MRYGTERSGKDPVAEDVAILEAAEKMGHTFNRPNDYLVCKSCGQSGRKGEYPFSTCASSGYCDDCF